MAAGLPKSLRKHAHGRMFTRPKAPSQSIYGWNGGIRQRVYQELEAANPSRFDGLVNIAIGETSYKKGHKYMTMLVNHGTVCVVWCGKGYGKEVLSQFFDQLT